MRIVSTDELANTTAESLGVSAARVEDMLKPALRRGAFLLAPCSSVDLLSFVVEPLSPLGDLRAAAEEALSELITYGDILEMRRVASDPWSTPAVTLRPAPPSFVMRGRHEAIVLGISGDLPSPLTGELADQVTVEGPVRVLRSEVDHLDAHLKLLGLAQLSEHVWLRTPAVLTPQAFLRGWINKLDARSQVVGQVDGLEILDPARPHRFYLGRWRSPAPGDDGTFVAKRAQAYGGKVWSFVRLDGGAVTKLVDLYPDDDWQRPSDISARLEAAIDAVRGTPQQFSSAAFGTRTRLAFTAPIPVFAERRLALVGKKTSGDGALFAFEIDSQKAENEAAELRNLLWLKAAGEGRSDNDNP